MTGQLVSGGGRGTPVQKAPPGAVAVFTSRVLLFLLLSSPVWGTLLGGWALWMLGTRVVGPWWQQRQERRERQERGPHQVSGVRFRVSADEDRTEIPRRTT